MKEIQKAVIKRKDKFLILLRSPKADFFPEHWDFPGGKLEPNEDRLAGIEREIAEETGLKVKALGIVGVYEMVLKKNSLLPMLTATAFPCKGVNSLQAIFRPSACLHAHGIIHLWAGFSLISRRIHGALGNSAVLHSWRR